MNARVHHAVALRPRGSSQRAHWQPSGLTAVLWRQIRAAATADGSPFPLPRLEGSYSKNAPSEALRSLVIHDLVEIATRSSRRTMIRIDPVHAGVVEPPVAPLRDENPADALDRFLLLLVRTDGKERGRLIFRLDAALAPLRKPISAAQRRLIPRPRVEAPTRPALPPTIPAAIDPAPIVVKHPRPAPVIAPSFALTPKRVAEPITTKPKAPPRLKAAKPKRPAPESVEAFLARGGAITRIETPAIPDPGGVPAFLGRY